SHSGATPGSPPSGEDISIAQNVSGLDVIVSGHSHTEVPAALVTNARTHKQVLVQQAGRFGDNLGKISLSVDGDGDVSFDTANSGLTKVDDKTVPDPAADAIAPTDIGIEGSGALRVSTLEKGKSGKLGFGDVFRAVPLGGSPVTQLPGYPLCRFGLYLAEVKAAFEITAGFAYSGHADF